MILIKKALISLALVIVYSASIIAQTTRNGDGKDTNTGRLPGAPDVKMPRPIEMGDLNKTKDSLNAAKNKQGANNEPLIETQEEIELAKIVTLRKKIYGSQIFNNENLQFDPNLRMATPADYRLGPDDELEIDVYGFSQKNFKKKIQPDGFITIENIGLINVSGLTIDEAKERIKNRLSKIFVSLLHAGNNSSSLNVSLNNVRTINVTVLGNAINVGTYQVSSLSTVLTVLNQAGGPNEIGSYRNVSLIRGDKVISKIDLYDFITSGLKKGDIRVMDQDRILIKNYDIRIELEGNVKRPGFYELLPEETIEKALNFAGGFTDDAYTNKLKVVRNTGKERQIIDVKIEEFSKFNLKNGDKVTVDKILERYENQVIIKGAVFRPGQYSLNSNKTLLELIKNAEGLKEDAFTQKAQIIRLDKDNSLKTVSINLGKILREEENDVTLQREDQIIISSNFDLKEEFKIRIRGEVNNPGADDGGGMLPFYNDITLLGLIIDAEGFKESAAGGTIDVFRRKKKSGTANEDIITTDNGKTFNFKINSNLKLSDEDEVFPLEPFDEVFVRSSPNYEPQQFVTLNGQVNKQGTYALERKDIRISDIVKTAGGLTPFAFAEGATLTREYVLTELELENKRKTITALQDGIAPIKVENEKISKNPIGIDMEKAMANPGSNDDMILQNNDIITIPKLQQTVKLSGEVLYPNTTQFDDSFSFKDYITAAGGFTSESLKKKTYILYANGKVKSTKNFLFFKTFPSVRPGSEIIVPKDLKPPFTIASFLSNTGNLIATIGTMITTILVLGKL